MHRVGKTYPGGKQVLKDISLSFFHGAKIGVLGLNGSGKSTLPKIFAGVEKDFVGEANPAPGTSIGFLTQEPELDPNKTVDQIVVEEGLGDLHKALKRFEEINASFSDPDLDPDKMEKLIEEQAKIQDIIETNNGWEIDHIVQQARDALRLPPGDAIVKNLSGGEKRRVALCRLLLQKPDMLLLDEPTNHLDAESVSWLEQFLQNYPGTVIAVTHDKLP